MILTTALSLIKFIPDVIGLFDNKRGAKAKSALETVGNIAESITGKKDDEAIKALSSDPNLAYEFKLAVMADSHVQEQMEIEDRKDARSSYKVNHEQVDKVADHIMKYNLVLVFLLVIINVIAVFNLKEDAALLAVVSNFIGIVIHALLNERQSVTAFFFGSSIGSKTKDQNKPAS